MLKKLTVAILVLSVSVGAFAGCGKDKSDEEDTFTLLLLLVLLAPRPATTIRFRNNSGATETYSLHTSITCSLGTRHLLANGGASVANGDVTAYETITSGSYYISYNLGTSCGGFRAYASNSTTTVISGTSSYSFTNP